MTSFNINDFYLQYIGSILTRNVRTYACLEVYSPEGIETLTALSFSKYHPETDPAISRQNIRAEHKHSPQHFAFVINLWSLLD
jgi:hypothetical protein